MSVQDRIDEVRQTLDTAENGPGALSRDVAREALPVRVGRLLAELESFAPFGNQATARGELDARVRAERAEAERDQVSRDAEMVRSALDAERETVRTLNAQISTQGATIRTMRAERDDAIQQAGGAGYRAEAERLRDTLTATRDTLAAAQRQRDVSRAEVAELRKQVAAAQRRLVERVTELDDAQRERRDADEALRDKRAELAELRDQLRNLREAETAVTVKLSSVRITLDETEQARVVAIDQRDAARDALERVRDENSALHDVVDSWEDGERVRVAELSEARDALSRALRSDSSRASLDMMRSDLARARDQVTSLENVITELRRTARSAAETLRNV